MDFLYNTWVQVALGIVLVALIIWWMKFRPQSY
jgi:hypothetical protein